MVQERRLIPFLGAGFSVSHALPDWDALLRVVAKDLRIEETDPKLTYEDLQQLGDGDFLRIAEYLFLRAGSSIGPLRYSMTNALHSDLDPLVSTPHVELVNLGCPQVYTTNFDEIIETTYRCLHQPVEVVALPRDVARADSTRTQIVKYHGDLRHDPTLVVTESQYWKRLDFESPMDLKFRSDLLGRSVMFIGYSFRDINIRVIWFKLMQMMRDVPVPDRLPSYMVRFEPNPVLEALYDAVGLRTIALDPEGSTSTPEERTALLANFLFTLAAEASPAGVIPGTSTRMFASDFPTRQRRGRIGHSEHVRLRVPPHNFRRPYYSPSGHYTSQPGYSHRRVRTEARPYWPRGTSRVVAAVGLAAIDRPCCHARSAYVWPTARFRTSRR